jgi:hypothetical protein
VGARPRPLQAVISTRKRRRLRIWIPEFIVFSSRVRRHLGGPTARA